MPEIGGTLVCRSEFAELPKDCAGKPCELLVRHNEIGIFESKLDFRENVIKGQVIHRDYRGSVTDHEVVVGNTTIIVASHRFCGMPKVGERKDVYLCMPPEAIRLVRGA